MSAFKISILAFYILFSSPVFAGGGHDHGHGHDDHHEKEPEKGPNKGKLLKKDDFAVEVTIFEDGVPLQYRVYVYDDDSLIDPDKVKVSIKLDRFQRGSQLYELSPKQNYLTSEKEVEEPHSFTVNVKANYKEKDYEWSYESHKGRTELSSEALKVANLEIETAGPAQIHANTEVYGRLLPNEDKVAHMYPRFPGIIKEVKARLGDAVQKNDILAIIESNQSLQLYEVRSLLSGTVIKRHAVLGEFVQADKDLFAVADLSEIWADFHVYREDFPVISPDQEILIQLAESKNPIKAKVSYVSPLTDIATQSKLVRAVISNADKTLRPGLFISGTLSGSAAKVPIAVKREAIQTFRDWNVVYITDGHIFQAMPVELGKQDQQHVEVISGIKEGDRYVSKNSFLIKSDVEKAGASHDH